MSVEIENNTEKYFDSQPNNTSYGYCYLNTKQGSYFWLNYEIVKTENVDPLTEEINWNERKN